MKTQIVMEKIRARGKAVKLSLFCAIVLTLALMTGGVYFRETVYISDKGVVKEVKTNETDAYAILKAENYELGPDDKITAFKDENGESHIEIHRAFCVTVTFDGESTRLMLTEGTAEDAVEAAGIELDDNDRLNFDPKESLYGGMNIVINHITHVDREVEQEKKFDTEYIDNSNLPMGVENVIKEGKNGSHIVTMRDTYVNGNIFSVYQIDEKVTVEPEAQIVERGTAFAEPYAKMENPETLKLVNGVPENYVKIVSGKATAYSAREGALTASGRRAVVGTVAVNPNIIPYGSEVYVVAQDGSRVYGYAIAADTGTGLMDGTVAVDVFMGSYEDSCRWGAVFVDIYVLSEGNG